VTRPLSTVSFQTEPMAHSGVAHVHAVEHQVAQHLGDHVGVAAQDGEARLPFADGSGQRGEKSGAYAVTSVMQTLSPIGSDEDRSVSASP
jgi:hypothetical protein